MADGRSTHRAVRSGPRSSPVATGAEDPRPATDAAAPLVAPAASLRLGLSTGALYPTPTEEVPALAAADGFLDLEVMLQTAGEYGAPFQRQLAARVEAAGCRVHAVHVWQDLHPLLSHYRRRAAEGLVLFDRAIAAAAGLGAKVVVWHGPKRVEVATPEGWGRFLSVTAERAAACGAAGLCLALENVSWCALASVREVAAFAAQVPRLAAPGHLGFAFDPFQAAEASANPFMLLAAMGGHVVDVHLSDRREGDAARHLPPGDGDLPWPALLRAIAGAYRGPLLLEGVVGADVARLRAVRQRLDPVLGAVVEAAGDPCAAEPPPGIVEGIALFNAGEFYACHEAIEAEWHAERGPIRVLYQGILQIGVGFHHALGGNHRGALLLLAAGIDKISRFAPRCLGIAIDRLAVEAAACLEQLRQLGPDRLAEFDPAAIPKVHRVQHPLPATETAPRR